MPALCDSTSRPPAAAAQSAARRQSSLRATEPATVSTLARGASSFAASASPAASTSIRIRVSWSLARRLATARPIPRAAPVTNARIGSSPFGASLRGAAGRLFVLSLRQRGRPDGYPLGEQRTGEAPLAESLCGGDQGLVHNVALGMAAADSESVVAHGQDRLDRAAIVVIGEGERAVDERAADLGRHLPVVADAVAFEIVERAAQ